MLDLLRRVFRMDLPEILCSVRSAVLYDENFCYALEIKQLRKHTAIWAEILCFSGPPIHRPNLFESPSPMQKCSPFLTIDLKKTANLGSLISVNRKMVPKNGLRKQSFAKGVHYRFVQNIGPLAEIYRTATGWIGDGAAGQGAERKKAAEIRPPRA